MTYYMAVRDYKAASHGVMPDYPTSYTIESFLRRKTRNWNWRSSLRGSREDAC
jgi:hypothetical protein